MREFISIQFHYCPVLWIFHSRQRSNKMGKMQERALRITYKDMESSYNDLLEKDCAITIHTKMTEM